MTFKVRVVAVTESGEEVVRDVACVERHELTPASLGLAIADSKAILQGLQEVVVEWQMRTYLDTQHHCPHCASCARARAPHGVSYRVWHRRGKPRFTHCPCREQATASFSPWPRFCQSVPR
jgi:hypothetical protein